MLRPIPFDGAPFDSIAMSLLLRSTGTIAEKAVAFDNLRTHLKPGGVIFGATVLLSAINVPREGDGEEAEC